MCPSDSPLSESNAETKLRQELNTFRLKTKNLSSDEIQQKLERLTADIQFLEDQVRADFGSYSLKQLEENRIKIDHLRRKMEILEVELARKTLKRESKRD